MTGRPGLYTIPSGAPFVDALAAGLIERAGGDRLGLADITVLLPTRRACRALADAFLRTGDSDAVLLPRLIPIGDMESDAFGLAPKDDTADGRALEGTPPIPALRRRLLLTRTILAFDDAAGAPPRSPAQAARLAGELARLLDQVQTERLGFEPLAELVPAELADHWQITLDFLRILTEHWPAILADEGCVDPATHRNDAIDARIAAWRAVPPAAPVIAAGSTGSVPATADLLMAVAGLPDGAVVLPGLDRDMLDDVRNSLDETHPQFSMMRLVGNLGVALGDVADWPAGDVPATAPRRAALINAALRPAEASSLPPPDGLSGSGLLDGLARIDCPGPQEEAATIALVLRQALEDPARTAALVTPDRSLARRVAAELRRWDIEIDDSAGQPLAATPPGVFLLLTARLASDRAAPVSLLSALKHPLAAGGMAPGTFRAAVRRLELAALRGPRPAPGIDGLRGALAGAGDAADMLRLLDALEGIGAPFFDAIDNRSISIAELLTAHTAFAEALAATDSESGAARLWDGDDGEALAEFIAELAASASGFAPIAGAAWPALLDALMAERVMRPRYGRHPRLSLWGPLEARLQHADLVVLGGVNEDHWPPAPAEDPWLSRPMRREFGLPPPEWRIGLSAHDFVQAFCAPNVVITRATRVEGTPTVPSRWLLRLDNLLLRLGLDAKWPGTIASVSPLALQLALDRPAADQFVTIAAPQPRPPVAARPKRLSVTQVETWMRDPYAVYARHVLKLRALDPIDADPGAAERGTVIHDGLDKFLSTYPDALSDDALTQLLKIGETVFGATLARPGVWAFWWPRFERIAAWFVTFERARRAGIAQLATEVKGSVELGHFTLTALADRVDRRTDGSIAIVDYKTGGVPTKSEVVQGIAPQLPLEAIIAASGGFDGVEAGAIAALDYWRLSGGDPPGEERTAADDIAALIDDARAGIARLIAAFDDPNTPYLAQPRPDAAPRYSDYTHLARIGEWPSHGRGGE